MKKSEAMDLYEGLNGISPKMIDEAEKYKKTASADIRHKKSNNVKKIMAAGLVAAAAVAAVLGVRELKPSVTESGNQSSNQLASEQTGYKIAHVMNVYAAGLDDTSECIFSNGEKTSDISGVVAGISSQVGDSSVMGQVMAGINVTGKDILKINYSIMGNDSDVTYNLARMKELTRTVLNIRHLLKNSEKRRRTAMIITLLKISGKSMRRTATVIARAYRL